MKKSIWKFPMEVNDKVTISMPKGAEILTIQTQQIGKFTPDETPCIWALVDTENGKEERYFEIFGTGHPIPNDMGVERKYINTFQLKGGALVFHLFERLN